MFKWADEVQKTITRTSVEKEEGLVFAIDTTKSKSQKGGEIYFLRMRIGSLAAKKAGLKAGDKVSLGWDDEANIGVLKAVKKDEFGWILSGLKRSSAEGKGSLGKPGDQALQLRFTWGEGYPSIGEPKLCKDVKILSNKDPERIRFTYPEGTSYTTLAPQKDAGKTTNSDVAELDKLLTTVQ